MSGYTFIKAKLTPATVERLTGIPPERLRNWRSRGLLDGFGRENDNGQWSYTVTDALGLAFAEKLELGVAGDRRSTFLKAKELAYSAVIMALDHKNGRLPSVPRYSVRVETSEDVEFFDVDSIADLPAKEFERMEIIDVWNFAKNRDPVFDELIKGSVL